MTLVDLESLSHLNELFDWLRGGRHLCADDGPLYLALRADFQPYQRLFAALGFDLVSHPKAFYYFQSAEDLGKGATQFAVFFVLVEAWGDAGRDLEAAAFAREGHPLAELPHFGRESWRQCMAEAGVTTEEELANIVKRLERLGFAERIGEDRFRFRAPAWRFFDLCLEILAQSDALPTDAPSFEEGTEA